MTLSNSVRSWIESLPINNDIKVRFLSSIDENKAIAKKISECFFDHSESVPLFIWNEYKNLPYVLFAPSQNQPSEPGEPGSILSYIRAHNLGDDFLQSDCYGQLSCSSCAVEVMKGELYNHHPREEEYDMLDIDEQKPATPFTRLSCQAVIGDSPLFIVIRK